MITGGDPHGNFYNYQADLRASRNESSQFHFLCILVSVAPHWLSIICLLKPIKFFQQLMAQAVYIDFAFQTFDLTQPSWLKLKLKKYMLLHLKYVRHSISFFSAIRGAGSV